MDKVDDDWLSDYQKQKGFDEWDPFASFLAGEPFLSLNPAQLFSVLRQDSGDGG